MDFDERRPMFPLRLMLYGSLIALLVIIIISVLLTFMTEFGWTGVFKGSSRWLLFMEYVAAIGGSFAAGWRSRQQGWLIGVGVGLFLSIWLLGTALWIHEPVQWGIWFVKTLIFGFISTFGGILGVNFSSQTRSATR